MADDVDIIDDDDEKQEDEKKEKVLSVNIIKYLTYLGLVLGVILISIVSSIIVNQFWGTTSQVPPYQRKIRPTPPPPRATYEIPEFKLPLDKKEDENITTIVQVKLSLAYKKDDQQTLNEIINRKEQIKDRIQFIIAKKKYEDISTARRREEDLKKDLIDKINNIMENQIFDIYFDVFVISRIPG